MADHRLFVVQLAGARLLFSGPSQGCGKEERKTGIEYQIGKELTRKGVGGGGGGGRRVQYTWLQHNK